MKPRILVTRLLPEPAMLKLEEHFTVTVNPSDRVLTKVEIIRGIRDCDILLCLLTDTIDAEIMDARPGLQGISNYAVGFNNIDVPAATQRKIPVTNTPGVLTETTADLTWALLLGVARRIVEADNFNRSGRFQGWGPLHFLGNDIHGKILGIIGTGRIGSAVARRAAGFNMKIIYTDLEPNPEFTARFHAVYTDLPTLLAQADFVTIHVPLSPQTVDLIGEYELSLMKSTACLINTSRGQVIAEKALVRALQEKRIAGAGLDVYYHEPELTPGLTDCPNTILTPHIASATTATRTRMGLMAAANAIALIQGEKPENLVNPEVWD